MGHDVFISYSSHDKKVADAACARLEQAGHRCWIAPRDILSGMEWGKAIVDAIRGARVFVLIFSANANRSPQVNREVERAVNSGLAIIPFRIEDVTPSDSLEYFISNQHWLDALTPPMERHLNVLVNAVARLLPCPEPAPALADPERAPGRARRWNWKWWTIGAALFLGLCIASAYLPPPASRPADNGFVSNEVIGLKIPEPIPAIPPLVIEPPQSGALLEFAMLNTDEGLGWRLPAEPELRNAAVGVRLSAVSPAGARLVIEGTRAESDGNAVRPTLSGNFLTLEMPLAAPSSFTLTFDEPLAELSFMVPATTAAGVIFPSFTVTAFDQAGHEVDTERRPSMGETDILLAQTFTLQAQGSRGIKRVTFASDPERSATFPAVLIETLRYQRMPRPQGAR